MNCKEIGCISSRLCIQADSGYGSGEEDAVQGQALGEVLDISLRLPVMKTIFALKEGSVAGCEPWWHD